MRYVVSFLGQILQSDKRIGGGGGEIAPTPQGFLGYGEVVGE